MAKVAKAATYLLDMDDDTQKKIKVPAGCTLTFGALIPGSQSNSGRVGLRVWQGKSQLAVFQHVKAFRSLDLQIEERVTTTKQETFTKGDGATAKQVVVESVVHEWVDPDSPKPQKDASGTMIALVRAADKD